MQNTPWMRKAMFVDDGCFTYLQCHTKTLKKKVEAFESDQIYRKMKEGIKRLRAYYELRIISKEYETSHYRRKEDVGNRNDIRCFPEPSAEIQTTVGKNAAIQWESCGQYGQR